jgi:hypothetical protein
MKPNYYYDRSNLRQRVLLFNIQLYCRTEHGPTTDHPKIEGHDVKILAVTGVRHGHSHRSQSEAQHLTASSSPAGDH